MHAVTVEKKYASVPSYRGNRPTNKQINKHTNAHTNRQDRLQYIAPLSLARSVKIGRKKLTNRCDTQFAQSDADKQSWSKTALKRCNNTDYLCLIPRIKHKFNSVVISTCRPTFFCVGDKLLDGPICVSDLSSTNSPAGPHIATFPTS